MELERLIVGTDFSREAERAIAQAMEIARHTGATLVLAHAHPLKETQLDAYEEAIGRSDEFRKLLRQSLEGAHELLGRRLERLRGQGVEVRQVLVDPPPEDGLCTAATELHAGMLVVGSRGRTGLRRLLLGSVAERVVRRATTPTLVARGEPDVRGGYRKILVPIDFSSLSEPAARAALTLASRGAEVDLLHCFQAPYAAYRGHLDPGTGSLTAPYADLRAEQERRGLRLARALSRPDLATGFRQVTANPSQAILKRLDEAPYDLVVVGEHARPARERFLLGSVAAATVRHAPCSVLVVRQQPR